LSRILKNSRAFERTDKKYRYSLEIVTDMLLIASVKVRKTRLMYQANLNFRQSEKYLKSLLESGLVECRDDSCYLITRRGKDFLQMYDDYVERCKRINDDVNGVLRHRLQLENMCSNGELDIKRLRNRKEVVLL